MHKLVIASVALTMMAVSSGALAAAPAKQLNKKPTQLTQQQKKAEVLLYSAPKGSVIAKLSPALNLVAIYQKGDWVKVGNPMDGKVGWVNAKQYRQAKSDYYNPNMQMTYVDVQQGNGKGKVNITAYRNGKKLSSAEAKKLYEKMKAEQKTQYLQMMRFNRQMNRMINWDIMNAQSAFNNGFFANNWFGFPSMVPPVVIIQQGNSQVPVKKAPLHNTHPKKGDIAA